MSYYEALKIQTVFGSRTGGYGHPIEFHTFPVKVQSLL